MKEELITFETAKLAKEKDFNILQHSYYFEDGEFKENSLKGTNGYYGEEYEFNLSEFNENWNDKWKTTKEGNRCFGCDKDPKYFETFSAPTQSLLQKWLREEHKFHVEVFINDSSINKLEEYTYNISLPRIKEDEVNWKYDLTICNTYEEALETALYQALKLIKTI